MKKSLFAAISRGSNMKTSIRNFLFLSLIVACVPVEAAHATKTTTVASQTKHSKKCSCKRFTRRSGGDGMGIGLLVFMILYTPIAMAQDAYYRKRKASEAKKAKTLKRKLQKKQKKAALETTSSIQS